MSASYTDLAVESRAAWRAWLTGNATTSAGVWVVTFKKHHGDRHVPYGDLVDEALAAGWIDSRPRTIDQDRSARLMTPRRPGSRWSRINRERIASLNAAGLMQPTGLAAVEAACADGSWTALDDVEDLREPADLTAALDRTPQARRHWDTFPPSTRRAILEWILSAKTTPTRTRRLDKTVTEAALGIRSNQWRQPQSR
jgi:uncharacterized protein YdeI (YjbR/CyaY-like superfamily)